jgi:hypothetical protein
MSTSRLRLEMVSRVWSRVSYLAIWIKISSFMLRMSRLLGIALVE